MVRFDLSRYRVGANMRDPTASVRLGGAVGMRTGARLPRITFLADSGPGGGEWIAPV